MIANIARYLGAAKYANPRVPYLASIEKYVHKISTSDVGNHEFVLDFPVASGATSFTWSGTSIPVDAQRKASAGLVVTTGDWYVNFDTGYVFAYDTIVSDWTLEYEPVVDGDIGSDASFNIMPDPDTDSSWTFRGVKIVYSNGTDSSQGYLVYLPPRGPLDDRRIARSPQDNIHSSSTKSSHSGNFQALPATGDLKFWQDGSVDADTSVNATHYRYNLPAIITGASIWGASSTIPQGLVHLWDSVDSGTILEGISLTAENAASPRTWLFRASGNQLDTWLEAHTSVYTTTMLQATADHSSSSYPANGLRVITVGSSLVGMVSSLFAQYLNHDHGAPSSFPARSVSHNNLIGTFDPAGSTPQLDPSGLDNDDHPQYLHRTGHNASRDKYENSLLGDLLIASTNSFNNYINNDDDSNKVIFGNTDATEGGHIYADATENKLVLHYRSASSGAGGILIGDPAVNAASSLSISANNNLFSIRPHTNVVGTSLISINADEVNIGALTTTSQVLFGRTGAPARATGGLEASGDIELLQSANRFRKYGSSVAWSVAMNLHPSYHDVLRIRNTPSGELFYYGLTAGYEAFFFSTDFPSYVTLTSFQWTWERGGSGGSSAICEVYERRADGSITPLASVSKSTSGHQAQSATFSRNLTKNTPQFETLMVRFLSGGFGLYINPVILLVGTYTNIDPYS